MLPYVEKSEFTNQGIVMEEKKKDRQKIRLKGQLKFYMQWPAIMAVVLVALNIWIYAINKGAGLLMGVFVLIYIILSAVMYLYTNSLRET